MVSIPPPSLQAHHHGVRYPQYLLLTLGWYDSGWWTVGEGEEDTLSCTQADREAVLDNTLIIWQFNFITDFSSVADSGIVSDGVGMKCRSLKVLSR